MANRTGNDLVSMLRLFVADSGDEVQFKARRKCRECNGTGVQDGKEVFCAVCFSPYNTPESLKLDSQLQPERLPCGHEAGYLRASEVACGPCGGAGHTDELISLDVLVRAVTDQVIASQTAFAGLVDIGPAPKKRPSRARKVSA